MKTFRLQFSDNTEDMIIQADHYKLEVFERKNLQGEMSYIMQYVFHRKGQESVQVPAHFVSKVEEIE